MRRRDLSGSAKARAEATQRVPGTENYHPPEGSGPVGRQAIEKQGSRGNDTQGKSAIDEELAEEERVRRRAAGHDDFAGK